MSTLMASSMMRSTLAGTPVTGRNTASTSRGPVFRKAIRAEGEEEAGPSNGDAVKPRPDKTLFCAGLAGNTGPFGDFDPAGLLDGKDSNTVKRYREAEVTHGRVCMLASVGILVGEKFNPLFDGKITGPAINHFQQVPGPFWTALVFVIALSESTRANVGWVNPAAAAAPGENNLFRLRDEYTPGDIGYDPLGLKPTSKAELTEMQNKEINNGRLAMIATAGMVVQELVTGQKVSDIF